MQIDNFISQSRKIHFLILIPFPLLLVFLGHQEHIMLFLNIIELKKGISQRLYKFVPVIFKVLKTLLSCSFFLDCFFHLRTSTQLLLLFILYLYLLKYLRNSLVEKLFALNQAVFCLLFGNDKLKVVSVVVGKSFQEVDLFEYCIIWLQSFEGLETNGKTIVYLLHSHFYPRLFLLLYEHQQTTHRLNDPIKVSFKVVIREKFEVQIELLVQDHCRTELSTEYFPQDLLHCFVFGITAETCYFNTDAIYVLLLFLILNETQHPIGLLLGRKEKGSGCQEGRGREREGRNE